MFMSRQLWNGPKTASKWTGRLEAPANAGSDAQEARSTFSPHEFAHFEVTRIGKCAPFCTKAAQPRASVLVTHQALLL